MSQYALPLSLKEGATERRIVIGAANRAAIDALANPADWPFGTAILSGAPRSGKSLLGRWFVESGMGGVVDDAHLQDEMQLFHRWNAAQENGQPLLLIVGDEEWVIRLPDLRSRLGAALGLEIGGLDDAMAAELIESHAAARGLPLGDDATAYLVPRVERSFAAIEALVERIDRLSLERKAAPTMSIWRAALEGDRGAEDGPDQGRLL